MRQIGLGFVLICLILASSAVYSGPPCFQAGANLTLGFPQGEFKENVDKVSVGGTGFFLYQLPAPMFSVGVSFSYIEYGKDTRSELFANLPVYVDVTTTNDILYGHLMAQIQPPKGVIRPYLNGLFGFSMFSTQTTIENQESNDENDEIASTTHSRDTALNYGFGGGLTIRVYDGSKNMEDGISAVSIDLGVRYLKGGNAVYVKEGTVEVVNNEIVFETFESETDIVTGHIGVTFNFIARTQ